jgi:non-heme chloroperoxidase
LIGIPMHDMHAEDKLGSGMEKLLIKARGATIAGDIERRPGAPLVIFSHGGGQTRHSWRGAVEAMWAKGFEAISLDLRGHGESSWPDESHYALELFAEDLNLVARTFGEGRPIGVVGASFGGMMSLLAAAVPDSPIGAVAMVDVVPRVEQSGAMRIRGFMLAHAEGFSSLEEAAAAIAEYRGEPVPRSTAGLEKNLRRREDGRWYWHWDPKFLSSIPRGEERLIELEQAAASYKGPLLLVHGLKSDVVGEAGVQALKELAPQLEYVDIAHVGHMVVNDRNDAFIDAVADFLSRNFAVAAGGQA